MDLPEIIPADADAKQIAALLRERGTAITGKNLLKKSWTEIANCVCSSQRFCQLVWVRLRTATTREDLLRVLRIVRKAGKSSNTLGGGTGRRHRHPKNVGPAEDWEDDYEYHDYDWDPADRSDASDVAWYRIDEFLEAFFPSSKSSPFSEIITLADSPHALGATSAVELDRIGHMNEIWTAREEGLTDPGNHGPIEVRLAEYFEQLSKGGVRPQLHESISTTESLLTAFEIEGRPNGKSLAKLAYAFSPFWIRHPLTWQKNSSQTVLEHLFAIYQVPKVLSHATVEVMANADRERLNWRNDANRPESGRLFPNDEVLKSVCWLIAIGQGGNLKRLSRKLGWKVDGQFQRYLELVPAEYGLIDACMLAEILRKGGNEIDYRRIASDPTFRIDPTNPSDHEFWHDTVKWFIRNRNELTDGDATIILQWGRHQFTESVRQSLLEIANHDRDLPEFEAFSWKRRSVSRVLELSRQYEQSLNESRSNLKWSSHGWNWSFQDNSGQLRDFVELVNGAQLFEEGKTLRHCVASYATSCSSGRTAIVSMRNGNTEQSITIEVDVETKQVVQARGMSNRNPTTSEKQAIIAWQNVILRADT